MRCMCNIAVRREGATVTMMCNSLESHTRAIRDTVERSIKLLGKYIGKWQDEAPL